MPKSISCTAFMITVLGAALCCAALPSQEPAGASKTIRLELNPETLKAALDSFLDVVGQSYDLQGKISIPPELLSMAGVSSKLFQSPIELGNGQLLKTLSEEPALANITQQLQAGAAAAGEQLKAASQAASDFLASPQGQTMRDSVKGFFEGLFNVPAADQPKTPQQTAAVQEGAAAGRRRLQQQSGSGPRVAPKPSGGAFKDMTQEEQLEHLSSIRSSLRELGELMKSEAAGSESESELSETATSRSLLQDDSEGSGPETGGPLNIGGYGRAYRVIFSNLFDFFYDPDNDGDADGLFFLRQFYNGLFGTLENYNWIGDLANVLDAPFDNLVNTNLFPLPQNNDEAEALVDQFVGDYCSREEASESSLVLGSYEGPTFTVTLNPVSCPITRDEDTGRNFIAFEDCDPATLVIESTPLTITEPYISAASYTGASCEYVEVFGVDTDTTLGGGSQSFTFRRSTVGVDLVPLINTFNINGRWLNNVDIVEEEDDVEAIEPAITLEEERGVDGTIAGGQGA